MQRIVLERAGPVGQKPRAVLSQLARFVQRQQRVGGPHPLRRFVQGLVATLRPGARTLAGIQPGRDAVRHARKVRLRRPQPFQQRHPLQRPRKATRVIKHHRAAHRVPHHRHPRPSQPPHQLLQIGQVIHEVVIAARADAIAVAVPAQIRRHQVIFAGQP